MVRLQSIAVQLETYDKAISSCIDVGEDLAFLKLFSEYKLPSSEYIETNDDEEIPGHALSQRWHNMPVIDGIPEIRWVSDSLSQVEALTSMLIDGQKARKSGLATSEYGLQNERADLYSAIIDWHASTKGEIKRLKVEYLEALAKHPKIAKNETAKDVATDVESWILEPPPCREDTIS